ncbi:MAG: uroporphyrinogen decarboxylase family protein [Armatimonadota bacterium]|nr:hypothetical protein [bacterium]
MCFDGIHGMVPREKMTPAVRKKRDFYTMVPGAPIYHREFGFYSLDRWKAEGHLPQDASGEYLAELFMFDEPASFDISGMGWCEAPFVPEFETVVIEDRGDYELVQDFAGRHVLYFKGRRSGFMPEYMDHPVKDMRTWQENCKWRMDPSTPERWKDFDDKMAAAKDAAGKGMVVAQLVIGGYMYLRSLIGPSELLYAFYDMPEVVHDCMQTWLDLAEIYVARVQEHVTLDEVFFGEDICYNHGCLISPDAMKEFLFPYYQQLISNIKKRQIDRSRKLNVSIDTDGYALPVVDIYRKEIGMNYMSPFEVASGCDVVEVAQRWPDLLIHGGIDKRILAQGPDAIDRELERIIPIMRQRGGYIPTCDHGVPEEVSFENYMHYRHRCVELGG